MFLKRRKKFEQGFLKFNISDCDFNSVITDM